MSAVAKMYFQRYAIEHIDLEIQDGVVESAERVCNLVIKFKPGYQVQFKLQGKQAELGELISEIVSHGRVVTKSGESPDALEDNIAELFNNIEGRLERIEHEQRVQSIAFLGNTFVLNRKTVFDVVEDQDGRLTIALHRGNERKTAMLLASSLLDGLYDGSIVLKQALQSN